MFVFLQWDQAIVMPSEQLLVSLGIKEGTLERTALSLLEPKFNEWTALHTACSVAMGQEHLVLHFTTPECARDFDDFESVAKTFYKLRKLTNRIGDIILYTCDCIQHRYCILICHISCVTLTPQFVQ